VRLSGDETLIEMVVCAPGQYDGGTTSFVIAEGGGGDLSRKPAAE
jgi:hypothetical protein